MNNVTVTSQTITSTTIKGLHLEFSYSQLIGVIIASSALFVSISILLALIIYHKYLSRINKMNNPGLTSNNLSYARGFNNHFERSTGQAYFNHSISTNFYDIDDIYSLDNDNFLNSLENAIYSGPRFNIDDQFSKSIVQNNRSNYPTQIKISTVSKESSSHHSAVNVSLKPKEVKSKKSHHKIASIHNSILVRGITEPLSESIGSTSKLITPSSLAQEGSIDSVCNSSKGSNQIPDAAASDRALENKSSHVAITGKMPAITHSGLPRTSRPLKRTTSAYTNFISNEDYPLSATGQILNPLRAGRDIEFINTSVEASSNKIVPHGRHLSHGRAFTNTKLFE